MSLRCNHCAAVDTAEIVQKQRKECESPKSTVKRVSSLKHRLPVDTDFLGDNQRDPTETRRVGDPTEWSTGWCQPPDTRPCSGTVPGPRQGSSLVAHWVSTQAHRTYCLPKRCRCCGRGSLNQVDFFNRVVCVTFDSHMLLLPRRTNSATPSTYCKLRPDWKISGTRVPSSALSCMVKAKLTPVKIKFYTE